MSDLKGRIAARARQFGADLVCFGDESRFKQTRVMDIFPMTKTVVCLGFRVLRGVYRGIEEGSTYYQYCTNGVEVMEEAVMPLAALRVCALLEDEGYLALPQRRHQCVMEAEDGHNFEMHYEEIYHARHTELTMDFEEAAVLCGMGERSIHGGVLTDEFGPMVRWVFVLTDAQIEPTPLVMPHLCDNCRECVKACPGHAIDEDGAHNEWQCGAYYRGASRAKNPFM
ncbi:MAG: 4Fe-4S binding protein, partial [Clostridia bacterium]|nr:4Fe-4S binding protein [Clostridia bacterium]